MGITVPVVPGIMLLQNYSGFVRMTTMCKSRVPQKIKDFGKDYLPLKLKKILDWQNFTLLEVLEQMKTRGIVYDNAEVGHVIALIKDFHK